MEKIIENPLMNFDAIYSNNIDKNPEHIINMYYQPDYFSFANGIFPWIVIMRNRQLNGERNYEKEIHALIKNKITRSYIEQFDDAGLFLGLSGVYYVLCISADDSRYDNLIYSIYPYLEKLIYCKINECKTNLKEKDVKVEDYDIVSGLSGILKFLLHPSVKPYIINKKLINDVGNCLGEYIYYPSNIDTIKDIPFYLNHEEILYTKPNHDGLLNLSFSHGLFGILNAMTDYYYHSKNEEILKNMSTVINDVMKYYSPEKRSWIKKVYCESKNNYEDMNFSWCYGDLTIMYSLKKVSNLLNEKKLNDIIINFFENMNINYELYPSPTFCHGLAGVLFQLTIIKSEDRFLVYDKLLSKYDSNYPYKYKDFEKFNGKGYYFDKNNFLTGSLGIYLTVDLFQGMKDKVMWSELVI